MKFRYLCAVLAMILPFCVCGCSQTQIPEDEPYLPPDLISTSDVSTSDALSEAAEPTAPPDTEPNVPEETRLSFVACGDNITYYGNVREAGERGGGTLDFTYTFDRIRPLISGADIAFVNQENVIAASYPLSYYPRFNVPRQVGDALVDCGFDIVNLANNHMLDKDEDGLRQAISYWRGQDVFLLGDYLDAAEYDTVRVYEKEGVRIAFLSYTEWTNGLFLPKDAVTAVPYLDKEVVRRQVAAAKEQADLVFVSVHWGLENDFTPTDLQNEYAALFADLGVDAVIGHHPHVIQPIRWLDGPEGHKTLCVYSLGNLTGEMAQDYNMVGGILSLDIVKTDGGAHLENVLFTPTVYYFDSSFRQNGIYLMKDFDESLAASHGIAYYGNSLKIETLRRYVSQTIDPAFLPEY